MNPEQKFHSSGYLAINKARWEHLEKLGIDKMFNDKTVFEPGAGIGDHTEQILKWGAQYVIASEIRKENLQILNNRFENNGRILVVPHDMDNPETVLNLSCHICYCYGLLYHLKGVRTAIEFMAKNTRDMLILETAVDYENEKRLTCSTENKDIPSHSPHGYACRPGRRFLFNSLKDYFPFVYMPIIQPDNPYYPLDWTMDKWNQRLARAVFIASHQEFENPDNILRRVVLPKQRI